MENNQKMNGLYLGHEVYERGSPGFRCHDLDYYTVSCNTLSECYKQLEKKNYITILILKVIVENGVFLKWLIMMM